jgi:hypothetical protein
MKLNGTHQLLVNADDVNLLGDNIGTIKKNTETVIAVSKEAGLEVNAEKTKYKLLSHNQDTGQIHYINTANRPFENVAKFQIFGNGSRKSDFHSVGNQEENEQLLPFRLGYWRERQKESDH